MNPMQNSRFSIFPAVRDAYNFLLQEWAYLLKMAALPLGASIATGFFVTFLRPDASALEDFLWRLPATLVLAGFLFLLTRLLLLGERITALPQDAAAVAERRRSFTLFWLTYILFDMGRAALMLLPAYLHKLAGAAFTSFSFPLGVVLVCIAFWGIRLMVLPTLCAVRYPLSPVLRRVQGPFFSLQLYGLVFTCTIPPAALFAILYNLLAPEIVQKLMTSQPLTFGQTFFNIVLQAPLQCLVAAATSAGIAFALRQILGEAKERAA